MEISLCPPLLISISRTIGISPSVKDPSVRIRGGLPLLITVQSKSLLLNNIIPARRVAAFHLSIIRTTDAPAGGEMHDLSSRTEGDRGAPPPLRAGAPSTLSIPFRVSGRSFTSVTFHGSEFRIHLQLHDPHLNGPDLLLQRLSFDAPSGGEDLQELHRPPGRLVL